MAGLRDGDLQRGCADFCLTILPTSGIWLKSTKNANPPNHRHPALPRDGRIAIRRAQGSRRVGWSCFARDLVWCWGFGAGVEIEPVRNAYKLNCQGLLDGSACQHQSCN